LSVSLNSVASQLRPARHASGRRERPAPVTGEPQHKPALVAPVGEMPDLGGRVKPMCAHHDPPPMAATSGPEIGR